MVKDLPPLDWMIELDKIYERLYDNEYFHPIVATIGTEIVGTGIAIVNGTAAWLGTIIVKEAHRQKGIGRAITEYLIAYSKERGKKSILLTASAMGLPVYKALGFEQDVNYLFFRNDAPIALGSVSPNIVPLAPSDHERIFALDRSISGEERRAVLADAMNTGVIYRDGGIRGYYLPEFGRGLVAAETEDAGVELLRYKLLHDPAPICLPETNIAGISFLRSLWYIHYLQNPRMFLEKNVEWKSACIYSRGCGYMG